MVSISSIDFWYQFSTFNNQQSMQKQGANLQLEGNSKIKGNLEEEFKAKVRACLGL
jgi:beta-xylosidase